MSSGEFSTGVHVNAVASGFQGVLHHGDGTATKTWAPTVAEARRKAQEVADE